MRDDFDPGWIAHRIVIERRTNTADGAGGAYVAWNAIATVWAAIEAVSAAEVARAGGLATRITHRITIRFRDDLGGDLRIRHRGRILRIVARRDPDERRRFLILDAEEETT